MGGTDNWDGPRNLNFVRMRRFCATIILLIAMFAGFTTPAAEAVAGFGRSSFGANTSVKYIGRLDDLKGVPRSQTLLNDLPDLGSARANYYQNSSVLQKALRDGFEIRDASAFRPNSELAPTLLRPDRTVGQTFLCAERLILGNKGLQPSPGGAYVPK